MLETQIFYDMNVFYEDGMLALDLRPIDCWNGRRGSKFDFIFNIFRRKDRSNSACSTVGGGPTTVAIGGSAPINNVVLPGSSTPLGSTKCPRFFTKKFQGKNRISLFRLF
jgi:hypothetical protein